jgi:hypothetical protein
VSLASRVFLALLMSLSMSLSACSRPSGSTLSSQQVADRWQSLCGEESAEVKIKKWEEDLDYLTAELEKRHKNLYHKISKEDFKGRRHPGDQQGRLEGEDRPGRAVSLRPSDNGRIPVRLPRVIPVGRRVLAQGGNVDGS